MTTMQKFKAYFGMVPPGDYEDDYLEDPGMARHRRDPAYRGAYREDYYAADEPYRNGDYDADYRADERDYAPLEQPRGYLAPADYERGDYAMAGSRQYESNTYEGRDRFAARRGEPRLEPLAPRSQRFTGRSAVRGDDLDHLFGEGNPLAKITTLRPSDYGEARTIGERFRDGNPVIMDLVDMSNDDAKRLVDFAAGLAFALRGSFDKVATKVFLLSPADIDVSAEDRRKIAETGFYNHS